MAPPVETSRKRRASTSPRGSPRSARSLLSQGVSSFKKTVQKGIARALHLMEPPRSTLIPLRSTKMTMRMMPRTLLSRPRTTPRPNPSSKSPSTSQLNSEAPSEDDDDDAGSASGVESDPEPRGHRGRPVAVQKRGGAHYSSPKRSAYNVLGKGKGKAPAPDASRRRSGRATRPSEKAREPLPTGSQEPATTSRKKKKSLTRRAKKKAKTSLHTVDLSSLPKAANIADSTDEEEGRTYLCDTKSVLTGNYSATKNSYLHSSLRHLWVL
ncbi:hypothetical protein BDZ89DRAFT_1033847 [Hymenopellis radicata]|nr:hypothetical protein BDZ89DRAFT_1033847 [Hymenopellis radicata]